MSWTAWTDSLQAQGFEGGCIIDRNSYAVLAQFGDTIPRGYEIPAIDQNTGEPTGANETINENTFLMQSWTPATTSIRFNQVKYMVFPDRSEAEASFLRGKKGDKSIYLYKFKTVFVVAVADASKLTAEQGLGRISPIAEQLKAAGI